MVRFAAALVLSLVMIESARAVDGGTLLALYGDGMKAYYGAQYGQAHETFTQAIEAGCRDPRCYYFRGLASLRLGRTPDAKLDFAEGAKLEAADFDVFYNVSGALQRVQGADRLMIEGYRADGRKLALKERERIRFEYLRRFDPNQGVEGSATTAAGTTAAPTDGNSGAPAPAATPSTPAPAADPFGGPAANPFAPAPAAPSAPPAPAPPAPAPPVPAPPAGAMPSDAPPTGTPAVPAPPAPAPPVPAPPATNPFGN